MDFVKNKPHFIHCNSDIEGPSKNTLMHFDIINCSEIHVPLKLMTWLIYMSSTI